MIRTEHLYDELNVISDILKKDKISDDEYKKASLMLAQLNTKLLHNLRTNMVAIMKHFNIATVKPKTEQTTISAKPEKK